MRARLSWLVILLAASALLGTEPVASTNNGRTTKPNKVLIRQNRLAESLKTWSKLKAKHGNYYRYEVYGGFLNFYHLTTITVQNGRVVTRAYEYFETNDKGEYEVMDEYSWTENGAAVGSHRNSGGAAPHTIDEIYRECRDTVLTRNPRAHDIYLDIGDDGVLRSCVYGFKGFAMDVYPGVSINGIEFPPFKDN